jgi:hypothetical protein
MSEDAYDKVIGYIASDSPCEDCEKGFWRAGDSNNGFWVSKKLRDDTNSLNSTVGPDLPSSL